MIVKKDRYLDEWVVRDGQLGFRVAADLVERLYISHLKYIIDRRNRRMFITGDSYVPDTIEQLPTIEQFLEMLATREWERKGFNVLAMIAS